MGVGEVLADGFDRIREVVHEAVDGLTTEQLHWRADAEANSIAWLVWHLTRVQDDHVAGVAGTEQVWTEQGWHKRFDLPFADGEIGYGQSSAEVAQVRVGEVQLLTDYHDAVHERSRQYVSGLRDADLDRVVDENWDPPVTLAVRLVSVLSDDLQHAGQAAYLRGLVLRR
ncbi:putative damage-inducible protein DinB [Kutzneria viridogrisea]|uniref:Chorismate synthase n=2 Tax=Kutzneria TaxID=43356 RepID=W5WJH7_9PSEU|nr:DUF664 domain-containing protein [Kutzneria albida]AHI00901.1 hypothetical protein KALB_7543 [Kutzneria albida DSM 43870]MBA8926178.1 putative damage-inducible protein DinB [Kutzneria viridogrisea]